MSTFDTVAIIVMSLSIIYSIFRGMVKEIFSLMSYVVGYMMAVNLQDKSGELMGRFVTSEAAARVIGFILTFILFMVIVSFIGKLIRKVMHKAGALSAIDRIIGGAIGLIKGAALLIIVMVPMELFPGFYKSVTKDSNIAPTLQQISINMRSGMGITSNLMDKPNKSLESMKDKVETLQKLGKLSDALKQDPNGMNLEKKSQSLLSKPLDQYSEKDKEQLKKIFESIQKQSPADPA